MYQSRLTGLKTSTALVLVLMTSGTDTLAGPTDGQVVGGDATITTPDAQTTVVNQTSARGIIEWNTFNVGSGEQLRFNQPSADAITLNRVTGGQGPSAIDGRIEANGRIIISNRDGIVFGDGAAIDVGALIATTADIENDAFMSGSLEFDRSGSPTGSVVNHGMISAKDGGLIALVAPHAENNGILSARVGRVAVAGGDRFTIDFSGSEFLRLAIDPDNPAAEYLAKNSGRIEAEGGHVLLTTQTASDALTGVVNNSGVVEATAVDTSGGRIRLVAGGGAKVRNSGTVRSRGTTGGTIEITAEHVELTSTSVVDASGDAGGGTVLVGGDYLGGNMQLAARNPLAPRLEFYSVYNATSTIAETGAQIQANALSYGDGGKIVMWSNEYTISDAAISARGGLSFGNGGFVETSGGYLDVRTAADTSATNGEGGTWLLDPRDITIVDGVTDVADVIISGGQFVPADDADTELSSILIEAQLNAGNRVIVSTQDTSGSEDGDITVATDITKSRGGDAELWLLAEDDIIISRGVDIESNANELDIFLVANDRISAGSMGELDTNGGFLGLRSGDDITIDTRSRMPEMAITNFPEFAASRVDVELDFEDDHVEFSYIDDEITVPTNGFQLLEFSGGPIYIDMDGDRTVSISDRSFLLQDGRADSFQFNHTSSYGVEASDALNGIPEVINFPLSSLAPFGENPPSGITPVVEVSNDEGLTVDRLVAASPAGEVIIAALEVEDEPSEPEAPIEEPVEPIPPVEVPSEPERPAEEPSDPPSSEDEPEETPSEPPVVEEEPESDEPVDSVPPTIPSSSEPTFFEGIVIAVMEQIVNFVNGDPSDEVEGRLSDNAKTDILEIIKVTNTVGSGIDAATEGQLASFAESYGYSWWEVFADFAVAIEILDHLQEGDIVGASLAAEKWVAEELIKDTVIGSAILKGSKTSAVFTMVLEYGINNYAELVSSKGFEYQLNAYTQARKRYSHEQIVSQSLDSIYLFDESGFFARYVPDANGVIETGFPGAPLIDYSGVPSNQWGQHRDDYVANFMGLLEIVHDASAEYIDTRQELDAALQGFNSQVGGS